MAHSYKSQYPTKVVVDEKIVQFFEDFYRISDTPGAHEEYANYFTKDATFILASKSIKGYEEILAARKAMWTAVASRAHKPIKVFPFGHVSTEFMLYGTVSYEMKDGRKSGLDFSARAKMVQIEKQWKMQDYQVYMDTAA
ncbi:hypothetical protein V500_02261 [Pseudogymnoascus sp. VKM F-4518 (FW-2643)]|nr:hypothetical protein V500_02261 [Pseudogymnoascus sp. VKM F-4518 (FW-2643)]